MLPFGAPTEPVPARSPERHEAARAGGGASHPGRGAAGTARRTRAGRDPRAGGHSEPSPTADHSSLGATVAWRAMYAAAILLAVITVIVTALGVAGVDLL